jgi:hypothetical protein
MRGIVPVAASGIDNLSAWQLRVILVQVASLRALVYSTVEEYTAVGVCCM